MAYSPIDQGRLPADGALQAIAERYGHAVSGRPGLGHARKARHRHSQGADEKHVRESRDAADLTLTAEDLAAIDVAFPPPSRKTHLQMLLSRQAIGIRGVR